MLSEALEFPRRGEDWLQTVLIGGVLSLLSFLIVPGIIVNGYLLRVLRAGIDGDETPPTFGDWADLLVDGILVWVVQLIFVGVPMFLLMVVVGSFAVITGVSMSTGMEPPPGAAMAAGGLVAVLLLLAVGLILLVAVYLLPAALANFARTGEFTAAFHLRTVGQAALSADYLIAMVLVIVVSVILGFIGSLLTIILVGIFVLFYLQMVIYHLFGQGFAAGLGLEPADVATTEPTD